MADVDAGIFKGIDAAALLKHSENWSIAQKVVGFVMCLVASAAFLSGIDQLRVGAGVLIALFGVALLTVPRRVLESQTIVLKDQNGKPRVAISAQHGLVLFDAELRPKVALNLSETGQPILHMRDAREQINIAVTENGAGVALAGVHASDVGVRLLKNSVAVGPADGPSATLAAGRDSAHLTLAQRTGPRVGLSLSPSAATMHLESGGGAAVSVQASEGGNVGMVLVNEQRQSIATLGGLKDAAHLSFFGENHIPVATYPDRKALEDYARVVAQRRTNAG
jgi:hypothetical protein